MINTKIFLDTNTESVAQILAFIATIFRESLKKLINWSLRFCVKIDTMYLFFNPICEQDDSKYIFIFIFLSNILPKKMLCLRLTAFFALQIEIADPAEFPLTKR